MLQHVSAAGGNPAAVGAAASGICLSIFQPQASFATASPWNMLQHVSAAGGNPAAVGAAASGDMLKHIPPKPASTQPVEYASACLGRGRQSCGGWWCCQRRHAKAYSTQASFQRSPWNMLQHVSAAGGNPAAVGGAVSGDMLKHIPRKPASNACPWNMLQHVSAAGGNPAAVGAAVSGDMLKHIPRITSADLAGEPPPRRRPRVHRRAPLGEQTNHPARPPPTSATPARAAP